MRWFDGEPFERVVALLTALVVVATASVAYLQGRADTRGNIAERQAQQLALEGMGLRARGEMLLSFEQQDAIRMWDRYALMGITAEDNGDFALADAYGAAEARVVELSDLLRPPYYDEATGDIDFIGHEADLLIEEAALISARFENFANLDDGWEAKAQNYVAQLTVLAVGLFLYSLSNTIPGRTRWGFVVLATVLTLGTLVATVQTARSEVPFVDDAVMQQYAAAQALAYREAYDDALMTYDIVLEAEPDYVRALIGRAGVHDDLGDVEAAIADYERVLALGGGTPQMMSDLGYAYYQNGAFEVSRDLARDRTIKPWAEPLDYFDLGLTLLALGDDSGARDSYAAGIALATDVVRSAKARGEAAPTAMWDALEIATLDIGDMRLCVESSTCYGTLDAEAYAGAALDVGREIEIWLRESLVALQFDAESPAFPDGRVVQMLTALDVGSGTPQTVFDVEDTTGVLVDGAGLDLTAGTTLVMKVFVDGFEDPTLREAFPVAEVEETIYVGLGEDSNFVLLPGAYKVDFYLDTALIGQALFEVGVTTADTAEVGEVVAVSFVDVSGWSSFVEEDGIYYADAEDMDAVAVVLVEPDVQADELVSVFDEVWGGDLVGVAETMTFEGWEGVRFAYTFEDGGDVFNGEALGVLRGADAVFVMVEVFDGETDTASLLDSVLGGVRLAETGQY